MYVLFLYCGGIEKGGEGDNFELKIKPCHWVRRPENANSSLHMFLLAILSYQFSPTVFGSCRWSGFMLQVFFVATSKTIWNRLKYLLWTDTNKGVAIFTIFFWNFIFWLVNKQNLPKMSGRPIKCVVVGDGTGKAKSSEDEWTEKTKV